MEAARRATADDVVEIAALLRQGTEELRPNRGGAVWSRREAHREPVEPIIAKAVDDDPSAFVVVGTVDDVVVGYSLMRFESLHDGEVLATISDLYVDPQARGVGVGEAMITVLEAEARRQGTVGLDALVLPGDRSTKNFFEASGMKARAILVHRSFVEPDDGPGER